MNVRRILPVIKCWTLWYALVLLGMPLLLLANEPATQPADTKEPAEPRQSAIAGQQPMDGVVKLPDGREINLADLAAQGGGMVMVRADAGDGNKDLTITEDGRVITIHEVEDEEIVVTITEDGAEPKEYRAANAEELEQNHPEAFEVYQRYGQDMMLQLPAAHAGAMVGQQLRVAVGGPGHAGPMGAFGAQRIEALGALCGPVMDDFVRTQLGDGVRVFRVSKDSVGARVGLERHDLIKTVNGTDVTNTEDLQAALENAGDKLKIEVVRQGKAVTLEEK